MSCRNSVLGAVLATLCFGSALGQEPELDPQMMCDAAAYQAYSLNSTDPDLEAANARVTEGVTDCKNKEHDQGMRKINEGTAMIHDHERTKMK
jgi:hypothetical protein